MRTITLFGTLSFVAAYGVYAIDDAAPALLAEIVCLLSAGIAAQAAAYERRKLNRLPRW